MAATQLGGWRARGDRQEDLTSFKPKDRALDPANPRHEDPALNGATSELRTHQCSGRASGSDLRNTERLDAPSGGAQRDLSTIPESPLEDERHWRDQQYRLALDRAGRAAQNRRRANREAQVQNGPAIQSPSGATGSGSTQFPILRRQRPQPDLFSRSNSASGRRPLPRLPRSPNFNLVSAGFLNWHSARYPLARATVPPTALSVIPRPRDTTSGPRRGSIPRSPGVYFGLGQT